MNLINIRERILINSIEEPISTLLGKRKKIGNYFFNYLIFTNHVKDEPRAGIEPATSGLRIPRYTG